MEWKDEDSGIASYVFAVYPLSLDSRGYLTANDPAVYELKSNSASVKHTPYSLPKPGMYAIHVTVTDKVGNQKRARELLLYDDSSQVNTTGQELHCVNIKQNMGKQWLQSTTDSLRLRWQGHFTNERHTQQGLLNRVLPWEGAYGIDDTTGNRTINPIQNLNGIVKFQIAYEVDHEGGKLAEARTWMDVTPLRESFDVRLNNLSDGDSVVVWVKAFDVLENNKTDKLVIHVDSSQPYVHSIGFQKNVEETHKSPYYFASR